MRSIICAAVLSLAFGLGNAFAQTSAPAATGQAAKTSKTGPASNQDAVSKSCSDQANAKGLHGKERKKFRSECKKNGGKAT
jgi:hypothetical protein